MDQPNRLCAPQCPKCKEEMSLVISAKIIESDGHIVVTQNNIEDHDFNCKHCGTNIRVEHLEDKTINIYRDFISEKIKAVNGKRAFIISEVVNG